ncbi:BfmA/BtgA family mobilization protein [uncultured Kriegella sp.]|uniref:BfmA/BtgA family mobilization protein n=1 Tax=uncultured Kriegella sp. TaxID=1798910 RepID=UPI0030DDB981|tara:strand:- start:114521 stop:114922 length:402 start_codon:yes stop_codon:yes gene_type:complete
MDKSFKNEGFSNIKIKNSIAIKFRSFALKNKESNSMTLDQMLEFFEKHQLSPNDKIPNHLIQVEKQILKRINAVIAILKDIEKTQTKPTLGMLQALFTADEKENKSPMFVEKKRSQRTLEEELKLWEKSNEFE